MHLKFSKTLVSSRTREVEILEQGAPQLGEWGKLNIKSWVVISVTSTSLR